MIICDVCHRNHRDAVAGVRYTFPVKRLDFIGTHQVEDILSVDLCSSHAQDFFAEFAALVTRYSYDVESEPEPAPGRGKPPATRAPRERRAKLAPYRADATQRTPEPPSEIENESEPDESEDDNETDAYPVPDPAEPIEDVLPEANRTYSRDGKDYARVLRIVQAPGKPIVVHWVGANGIKSVSRPDQFSTRFGVNPIKGK
jgi:hypothetical protein